MIKLDQQPLELLRQDYQSQMRRGVLERYQVEISRGPIPANSFTARAYTSLFEIGTTGSINVGLISDLLSNPLDQVCTSHPEIEFYIQICKLVYYRSWQIDKELEKNQILVTKRNREAYRIQYVERYCNGNPWISDLLAAHVDYYRKEDRFKDFIDDVINQLETLNSYISGIIDYKFMDADFRHEILTRMGTEVCPYCNRQFITKYKANGKIKSTADLDHFYPKSVFQLLSLSLYNFVPSCQQCNSRFKLARGLEIIYPYDRGFQDDAYFKVELNDKSTIDSLTGQNSNFDLDIYVAETEPAPIQIRNSIKMFHISEVYQSHKDHVRELLFKKQAYNHYYKEQLVKLFETMKLTEEDINLFLYGNQLLPTEQHKRPLSKLTYDVVIRK